MTNTIKVFWLIIAVLFLAVTFFALNYFGINVKNPFNSGSYYAVYLVSGDIYFGKLSTFPRLKLSDVYFLVKGKDQSGADAFAMQRLKDAVWGPEDSLYLNPKNILWKTKLKEGGAALRIISGGKDNGNLPDSINQQNPLMENGMPRGMGNASGT